jgi:hypothetical protein
MHAAYGETPTRTNAPAYLLRSRRSRVASLTLSDPCGECELLWRNPAMKGFTLLDTAIDGRYGFRPPEGAVPDNSEFGGSVEARTTAAMSRSPWARTRVV